VKAQLTASLISGAAGAGDSDFQTPLNLTVTLLFWRSIYEISNLDQNCDFVDFGGNLYFEVNCCKI